MKIVRTLICGMSLVFTTSIIASEFPETDVSFQTADSKLQRLFDAAETKAAENTTQFTPTMKILVEGGGYPNAWIETQPMGGEMYAKRDLQMALNNQVVFMLGQRDDGRMPGMVVSGDTVRQRGWDKQPPEGYVWLAEHDIAADYEMFQGYCFPEPAWRMYFWIGKDKAYLCKTLRGARSPRRLPLAHARLERRRPAGNVVRVGHRRGPQHAVDDARCSEPLAV